MKVRELRKRKFWSQAELAEAAGLGRETIARLETGKNQPHGKTIRALAAALGVEPQELVKEEATA